MAPIKYGTTLDDRDVCVSYEQKLRTLLAILPAALQSPATEKIGKNSPFSLNGRTHLCRFIVLDDIVYNGRESGGRIAKLFGEDPIVPRKVDQLNCAYLMFAADFDAVMKDGDPLPVTLPEAEQDSVRDAYARRLWETMEPDLSKIYENCWGFEKVHDADGFADYIRRCQVETTMPFNDYWLRAPELNRLNLKGIAALVGIPALVTVFGLLGWIFGWAPGWVFLGGLLATLLAISGAYAYAMWNGNRPMPPGEYADLPSVLKSIYLQQTFAEFVIGAQGKGEADLHDSFGKFIQEHEPGNKMSPSQEPGVVSITRMGADSGEKGI